EAEALQKAKSFPGLEGLDLAKEVSSAESYKWNRGIWPEYKESSNKNGPIVAYDFGIKTNILRLLSDYAGEVHVVNAKTSFDEVMELSPRGIFLSNGPGDPEPCTYAIENIKKFLDIKIPIFGICLGHQLLALAGGAKTHKMKFGHHGANHPVQDIKTKEVMITSQNHGFAVDIESLPDNIRVSHISLFDQSLQGIEFQDTPAFSFQGHPEASPGPQEIQILFSKFNSMVDAYVKT
ncbi:carbamoyl phosphate synthase small subunit, partial [Gammaproteobacteria bacterium]|nr:carbamoyl phosphate synthase small subunit [Gammaproteobacteria bacterium]